VDRKWGVVVIYIFWLLICCCDIGDSGGFIKYGGGRLIVLSGVYTGA